MTGLIIGSSIDLRKKLLCIRYSICFLDFAKDIDNILENIGGLDSYNDERLVNEARKIIIVLFYDICIYNLQTALAR
jgi:hypothetical protein